MNNHARCIHARLHAECLHWDSKLTGSLIKEEVTGSMRSAIELGIHSCQRRTLLAFT